MPLIPWLDFIFLGFTIRWEYQVTGIPSKQNRFENVKSKDYMTPIGHLMASLNES